MAKWNRREFLTAMASTGISSYAGLNGWKGPYRIKAGIGNLTARSLRMSALLREMSQVSVAAVVGGLRKTPSFLTNWEVAFPDSQPKMYSSVGAMLEQCPLDFLYTNQTPEALTGVPVNLLLEDLDPSRFRDFSESAKCVQVLPQYEFGGFGPVGPPISGKWTHAIVDCRSPLPPTPFQNRGEFAFWLYRQVGEAMEFAQVLMEIDQLRQVFAAATPGASPYEAKFGWRFVSSEVHSPIIDLSVVATHSVEQPRTKITLRSETQSVSVCSAPRSRGLTRFLIWNFLESVRRRKRETLLYDPHTLSRSWALVSHAADSV